MTLTRTLLFLLLTIAPAAQAADFQGKVIGVMDGDTVSVLTGDKTPIRVRLANIDAPEKGQAFGARAKQALSSMTYGHLVTVSVAGSDRYGRTIGTLYLQGEDVNRLMVASGMAWAYRAYLQDQAMVELEAKAKAMRLGLWVDPNPVAPWQFRRGQR